MNITHNPRVIDVTPEYRARMEALIDLNRQRWWLRCGMKILVVADNFLYFDDDDFGLSYFVDSLRSRNRNSTPVTVDTAHRGNPGNARLNGATPNFTFDYDTLRQYHQVWIFAADYPSRDQNFGATPAQPITNAERQAIRQYMDNGGGIFATGDHEDLGVTVGGYIPRVRSMRRWFYGVPNPAPQGEPRAPDGGTSARHDTNREGHDAGWEFEDQSDDIPQPIIPKLYNGYTSSGFALPTRRPHPILCGPNGTIKVLPDHPHEGVCELPADINATYTIGGDTFDEYPTDSSGNRVWPEVIADATILAGAETQTKPPTPAGRFGVIGAYDGHRAGVGRIVVDATWHHFININLIGDRDFGAPNPAVPKSMGFLHTTTGQGHLTEIEHYFFNIAKWLSPNVFRGCILQRTVWEAIHEGHFAQRTNLSDTLQVGRVIHDRLRIRLGRCESLALVWERFREVARREWPLFDDSDPFNPSPRRPQPDPVPFEIAAEDLVDRVLGETAMILKSLEADDPITFLDDNADKDGRVKVFDEAVEAGVRRGLQRLARDTEQRAKRQMTLVNGLEKVANLKADAA